MSPERRLETLKNEMLQTLSRINDLQVIYNEKETKHDKLEREINEQKRLEEHKSKSEHAQNALAKFSSAAFKTELQKAENQETIQRLKESWENSRTQQKIDKTMQEEAARQQNMPMVALRGEVKKRFDWLDTYYDFFGWCVQNKSRMSTSDFEKCLENYLQTEIQKYIEGKRFVRTNIIEMFAPDIIPHDSKQSGLFCLRCQ